MELFLSASKPLGHGRDILEDAIEEFLGGDAEVTGGGAGNRGWNIDVDACRELAEADLGAFCKFLIEFGVDSEATLDIYEPTKPNRRIKLSDHL